MRASTQTCARALAASARDRPTPASSRRTRPWRASCRATETWRRRGGRARPRRVNGAAIAAVADGAPARGVAVAAVVRHVVLAGRPTSTDGAQPRPREAAALGRVPGRRPGRAGGGVSSGASPRTGSNNVVDLVARQQTNLRTGVKRAVLRDDAAFFERGVLREATPSGRTATPRRPSHPRRPPVAARGRRAASPALPPRRPPAPSSPPTGPPPQRQWDEARPWVAADEALADIAEAASIVDASTSGQDLDPRALALVPWAHQIIELRTLIGAKGMETLSAGREPVPRFAVTWAKLRTQRAEIDRAARDAALPKLPAAAGRAAGRRRASVARGQPGAGTATTPGYAKKPGAPVATRGGAASPARAHHRFEL